MNFKEKMDRVVSCVIIGPTLIAAGVAIDCGLYLLKQFPPHDAYHAVGVALGAEMYSIVAGLFVLLGLRYICGPKSWFEEKIASSLKRLFQVAAISSAVIVAAVLLIVWGVPWM